ncbi:MAG: hypothetical protein QM760_02385 [Nibricoccus sp.]
MKRMRAELGASESLPEGSAESHAYCNVVCRRARRAVLHDYVDDRVGAFALQLLEHRGRDVPVDPNPCVYMLVRSARSTDGPTHVPAPAIGVLFIAGASGSAEQSSLFCESIVSRPRRTWSTSFSPARSFVFIVACTRLEVSSYTWRSPSLLFTPVISSSLSAASSSSSAAEGAQLTSDAEAPAAAIPRRGEGG